MPSKKRSLLAASGAGSDPLYVEDVFSTYLYTGNDGSQTLTNGIDLDGEGGMVWQKRRSSSENHIVSDSARGLSGANYKSLSPNNTLVEQTSDSPISSFNTNGFSMDRTGAANSTGETYVSWTFRKAEKFFDVVTYAGDSTSNRQISHSLNADIGMIVIKVLDAAEGWPVWHKDLTDDGTTAKNLYLNTTGAEDSFAQFADSADQTSTYFTLGSYGTSNNLTGKNYVAYLFASDAGGFGEDGDESVVKCGSYVGNISSPPTIDLGWEPQYILFKAATNTANWCVFDVMRGWVTSAETTATYNDALLRPNTSAAEGLDGLMGLTSTGFKPKGGDTSSNGNGVTYIYMAIRRPMKTPESGTEVFAPISLGTTTEPGFISNFVTDFVLHNTVDETGSTQVSSRMTGNKYMFSDATNAEGSISAIQWDFMDGSRVGNGTANADEMQWMFKRAAGFMDVVCYTGTGANTTQAHNLGVAPELMLVKRRDTAYPGRVYAASIGNTKGLALFTGSGEAAEFTETSWNSTTPSNSLFSLGNPATVNASGSTYIAYLFATLAGVSKVGSYTGTGADLNVDCGFTAGARFILIKRSDSTGDWYVYDSLRGISAGNDPYFFLNSTAAEVTNTDYIDPLNAGFTVTSNASSTVNVNGGTYIFLAIA